MIEERIKQVMSDVFELEPSQINDESSPDTIESWDSLRGMNLITSLEEEFGIQFSDEEMLELLNYRLILEVIKNKQSNN